MYTYDLLATLSLLSHNTHAERAAGHVIFINFMKQRIMMISEAEVKPLPA
jgi:hypothetical protein